MLSITVKNQTWSQWQVKGGIIHPNNCTQQQIYITFSTMSLDAEKSQKWTITSRIGIARFKQNNAQKMVEKPVQKQQSLVDQIGQLPQVRNAVHAQSDSINPVVQKIKIITKRMRVSFISKYVRKKILNIFNHFLKFTLNLRSLIPLVETTDS